MRIRKWLMKQQWRIGQIRGIWGLSYGILLLAYAYYGYVPFFADMGVNGPFLFAGITFAIFLILGYVYDKIFVMWAPTHEVTQERNPYQYVAGPKDQILWFPVYSSILEITHQLSEKYGLETDEIMNAKKYYAELQSLGPERRDDIEKAIELRKEFISRHSFSEVLDDEIFQ